MRRQVVASLRRLSVRQVVLLVSSRRVILPGGSTPGMAARQVRRLWPFLASRATWRRLQRTWIAPAPSWAPLLRFWPVLAPAWKRWQQGWTAWGTAALRAAASPPAVALRRVVTSQAAPLLVFPAAPTRSAPGDVPIGHRDRSGRRAAPATTRRRCRSRIASAPAAAWMPPAVAHQCGASRSSFGSKRGCGSMPNGRPNALASAGRAFAAGRSATMRPACMTTMRCA